MTQPQLAAHFTGPRGWQKLLPSLLQTLETVGRAEVQGGRWRAV